MLYNFSPENRAAGEIKGKKHGTARQAADDNIILRIRFACWVN
jgi:hypothetical protein